MAYRRTITHHCERTLYPDLAGGEIGVRTDTEARTVTILLADGTRLTLWERDLHNLSMAITTGKFEQ